MKGLLIAKAAPVILIGTAVVLLGYLVVLAASPDEATKSLKENEYFG